MDVRGESKRVAIACQGGGSHTVFTAGVLKKFLRSEEFKRYEVVGLSGTSGGAVCALLAWHNLLRGDGSGAAEALDAFWRGKVFERLSEDAEAFIYVAISCLVARRLARS